MFTLAPRKESNQDELRTPESYEKYRETEQVLAFTDSNDRYRRGHGDEGNEEQNDSDARPTRPRRDEADDQTPGYRQEQRCADKPRLH